MVAQGPSCYSENHFRKNHTEECIWVTQLDRLVEKQRETHRRMLEQLLLVEQAHKQALCKLEDEKRNHSDFVQKSDEFTNLLEQERERSVTLSKLSYTACLRGIRSFPCKFLR